MRANISALTQSSRNANDGTGKLQVADGALAQVTNLLNRAVTLATESANGTVSDTQRGALDAEFTAIKAEIDRIGSNTTFNGTQVFSATSIDIFLSDSTTTGTSTVSATTGVISSLGIGLGANASNTLSAIGQPAANDTVTVGSGAGTTYKFVAALTGVANEVLIGANVSASLANLASAVNGTAGAGVAYGVGTVANTAVSAVSDASTVTFTAKVAGTGGNALVSTEVSANIGVLQWCNPDWWRRFGWTHHCRCGSGCAGHHQLRYSIGRQHPRQFGCGHQPAAERGQRHQQPDPEPDIC